MAPFPFAHATHPQWSVAVSLVLAQLGAQRAVAPPLGVVYITDHFAAHAQEVLDQLMAGLPEVTDWVGAVGLGIAATGVEYWDEPALAVMLVDVPADQFQVFNGVTPLPAAVAGLQPGGGSRFVAQTALVHADAHTPDLPELIVELAQRTRSAAVFGGVVYGRERCVQFAHSSRGRLSGRGVSPGVLTGGLSGVAFGPDIEVWTRVTQGCRPMGAVHTVTRTHDNVVLELDGVGALDRLLSDANVSLAQPDVAVLRLRQVLAGIRPMDGQFGQHPAPDIASEEALALGAETRVRHIIGLDTARRGFVLSECLQPGEQLVFCERHAEAARMDLLHMCKTLREDLAALAGQSKSVCGVLYISCNGRGGAHFGAGHAELQCVQAALGDIPLVGLFAGGEIAGQQLYGYTGVLTVFVADVASA